jgi:hypothetical protein
MATSRSLTKQIERVRNAITARQPKWKPWPDTGQWIALLKEQQRAGYFSHEPDFPKALALYEEALQRRRTVGPAVDPSAPANLRPAFERFPDVLPEFTWLSEIVGRVSLGVPPVTEAEFTELAEWFWANEQYLKDMAGESRLMYVGRGRQTCCWYVREAVRGGPRAEGAGDHAEDIRQLRARYGGPGS